MWYLSRVRINGLKHTLNSLVFHFRGLLRKLKGPDADHVFTSGRLESELNLSLRFSFSGDLPKRKQ